MARGKISTDLVGTAPATLQPTVAPGPVQYIPPGKQDATATGLARLADSLQLLPRSLIGAAGAVKDSAIERGQELAEKHAALTTQEILDIEGISSWVSDWTAIGINDIKGTNLGREWAQNYVATNMAGGITENSTQDDAMGVMDEAFADYVKTFGRDITLGPVGPGDTGFLERNRKAMSKSAYSEYNKMRDRIGLKALSLIEGARNSAFKGVVDSAVRNAFTNNDGYKELLKEAEQGSPGESESLMFKATTFGIPKHKVRSAIVDSIVNSLNADAFNPKQLYQAAKLVTAPRVRLATSAAGTVGPGTPGEDSIFFNNTEDLSKFMIALRGSESRHEASISRSYASREAANKKEINVFYRDLAAAAGDETTPMRVINDLEISAIRLRLPINVVQNSLKTTGNSLTPIQWEGVQNSIVTKNETGLTPEQEDGLTAKGHNLIMGFRQERSRIIASVRSNPSFKSFLHRFANVLGGKLITTMDGTTYFTGSGSIKDQNREVAAQALFTRVMREMIGYVRTPDDVYGLGGPSAGEMDSNWNKVFIANLEAWNTYNTPATQKNTANRDYLVRSWYSDPSRGAFDY